MAIQTHSTRAGVGATSHRVSVSDHSDRAAGIERRFDRRTFIGLAALLLCGGRSAFASEFSASAETEAALADAQARYQAALDELAYLNNLVFDAEAVYDQISTDLYNTILQIEELQASIDQKQAELAEAQDILADRLASSYRAGKTDMLGFILGAADFNDFVSRVYYANKVSDSDAEAIQNVKDIKASLEADQAALREQQAYQEQLQAEQAAQLEILNAQVANTEAYAASLDWEVQGLIAQRDAEIAAAAEAARIAAEEEARRQAEAGGGDYADGGYADGGSSGGSDGGWSGGGGYQPANVVAAGYNYIGTPYSVLDCSGFTSAAYGDCGYYLYHQSGVQYSTVVSKGNLVGADSLVPGNLVFYARGGSIYHVGMYIGGGMVIDSIPSGGVQVRSLYFCDGFCGGGSPL